MGSLLTPPGHPAHVLALITAKFGDLKIAVEAPDPKIDVRPANHILNEKLTFSRIVQLNLLVILSTFRKLILQQ